MGDVVIDGFPLRINPTSIAWDFALKTKASRTIGGKVVQVYGVKLGDLRVGGKCSKADFMAIYEKMHSIAMRQVPTQTSPVMTPVSFTWAARQWSFWVYLKGFKQSGAQASIEESNQAIAPEWEMSLFIAEDNSDIVTVAKEAAQASYIRRISQGLGWAQTSWNGKMGIDDLQAVLQGQTLQTFLFNRWAEITTPTGIVPKTKTTTGTP